MVRLFDSETGAELGTIGDEQLRFLEDHLEEESSDDRDYYFNGTMIDVLEEKGADPELVGLLRRALGEREGVEIRWQRER
ncbi:MAG TPA: galactosyldiacylglycerol synthase [Thermoanaerobaculia bacterium]|jgi:processive 1,2-diacylglycerol beta-glucosyltransferase|nr:galactosyldiacylglycerol synthase [Thermoanaerobaculia bacterium]